MKFLIKARDKFGGNSINSNRSNIFQDCINKCNLVALGFKGSKYTWTNKRYRQTISNPRKTKQVLCQLFLDSHLSRSYCNPFTRTHSDRYPLFIRLYSPTSGNNGSHPFRFKLMWCGHLSFHCLVSTSSPPPLEKSFYLNKLFQLKNIEWNKNTFGNIFKKKRKLIARLAGIKNLLPISLLTSFLNHNS